MITINKNNLDEIKHVCSVAKSKSPIEALQNVKLTAEFDSLTLKASDMNIEITRSFSADIDQEFETTVNAQKFSQSIAACGEQIKVEFLGDSLQIKSGRKRFKLPALSADAFPEFPEPGDLSEIKIDSIELAQLSKSVLFASGINDVRYVLNGVFIGNHIVGTDGHRMSWIDSGLDCNLIIPRDSVNLIPEISGGKVYFNQNVLCIEFDNLMFKTKLVDGKYVSYERLIPSYTKSISVNKTEFIDSIKSAMITANEKSRAVIFSFGDESTVRSKSGSGHDSVIGFESDCSECFEVAVNSDYILAAISNSESEEVKIQYKDETSPLFIGGEIINSIVMPVRV